MYNYEISSYETDPATVNISNISSLNVAFEELTVGCL